MQIHNGKTGLFCIFCNKPCISYLLDFKYRVTFDKSFAMWGKTADKDIKLKQWAAKNDNGLGCSKAICVCVVGGGDRQEETLKVCSSAFLKNGPLLPGSAGYRKRAWSGYACILDAEEGALAPWACLGTWWPAASSQPVSFPGKNHLRDTSSR